MNDLPTLLKGGLGGVIVTSAVALAGLFIKRSTTLDGKRIDDRALFTTNLMSQLAEVNKQVRDLTLAVQSMQRREMTLIRLFATLGGELRVLNGYLGVHLLEIRSEELDRDQLVKQTDVMLQSLNKMTNMLEAEENILLRENGVDSAIVSPPPGDWPGLPPKGGN
jgi:hypothetical protein